MALIAIKKRFDYRKTFKQFCKDFSVQGYSYLVKRELYTFEKVFWLLFNISTIIATVFYVILLWIEFTANPTVVSLDRVDYPISEVLFPGVAICNVNKISYKKALEFANFLKNKHSKNLSSILKDIQLLGSLYDFEVTDKSGFVEFQMILDKYDRNNTNAFYEPTLRLKMLSPTCDDLLLNCSWLGNKIDCMDIFDTRLTYDGFCCTFNYVRPIVGKFKHKLRFNVSAKAKEVGIKKGLSVTVNNEDEDYFYTNLEMIGVVVNIFYSKDYPDKASGALTDVLVSQGTEVLIRIDPVTIKATEEVRYVQKHKRGCIFENDETTVFGAYRFSDCFVDMKLKSVLSLCNCVPFMFPVKVDSVNVRYCTLVDVPCLSKFKRKWMTYFPRGVQDSQMLELEKHDSLYSERECMPTCDTTLYYTHTDFINCLTKYSNHKNKHFSTIHVFYDNTYTDLYKQDVVFTWFEMLGAFGGVFSLFMGLSLINIVEILFFFGYRLIFGFQ